MQLLHRLGPVAGEHFGQHAEGVVDALVQQLLLAARGAAEDEAGDQAGVAGVADAQAQAVEAVLIAALRDVIESLCDRAWAANPPSNTGVADVPDMKEFFQFAWADRQYVMRKRQWP